MPSAFSSAPVSESLCMSATHQTTDIIQSIIGVMDLPLSQALKESPLYNHK
jgi:hypothetical protein